MKEKIKSYLELGRVSNIPSCVSNILAAYFLSSVDYFDYTKFILLSIGIISLYISGMFMNDLFDFSYDSKMRPERPIPSGRLNKKEVIIGISLLTTVGFFSLLIANPTSYFLIITLILTIFLYNFLHKKFTFSPILMGICRGLVYFITAYTIGWYFKLDYLTLCAMELTAYITLVSFIARNENNTSSSTEQKILISLSCLPFVISLFFTVTYFPELLPISLFCCTVVSYFIYKFIINLIPAKKLVGKMLGSICLLDACYLCSIGEWIPSIVCIVCFYIMIVSHKFISGT